MSKQHNNKKSLLANLPQWLLMALLACQISAITSSCSSIDCPVLNSVNTFYSIRDTEGNAAELTDTLWIWTQLSDGTDKILLNRLTGKSEFTLPISYSHPEDMLVFFLSDTTGVQTLDTLWLKKDDIPHFESVDCSASFFHRLTGTRYTRNGIDSVKIVNSKVDFDQSKTHLYIVFKKKK